MKSWRGKKKIWKKAKKFWKRKKKIWRGKNKKWRRGRRKEKKKPKSVYNQNLVCFLTHIVFLVSRKSGVSHSVSVSDECRRRKKKDTKRGRSNIVTTQPKTNPTTT